MKKIKEGSFSFKRFFLVLTLSIVASLALLFILSISISFTAFTQMNENDIYSYMEQGQQLLLDYNDGKVTAQELNDILNPKLKTDSNYMILLDSRQEILAANEAGLAYFKELDMRALTQELSESGYYKLNVQTKSGADVPNIMAGTAVQENGSVAGYVFAGKILYNLDTALKQYRVNLLLMLILVLALSIFPGYWMSKRLSEPARILKDAAMRLAGGDLHVRIDKKLKGEMGQIATAFNDMSERLSRTISELGYQKKSTELILEGLSEGIVAMDGNFEIVRENNAVESLFKDKNKSAYLMLKDMLKKSIQTKEELYGRLKEGDKELQYAITHIETEMPGQSFAVALVRDITENVRLEKTRHDYVANISHELRTPLSSMRGLIEGLRDGMVTRNNDKQRYYSIISGEVLRLSRLVDDLLELSGLQSRTAAFEMERIDVTEMMYDLHDRYKKMFEEGRKQFFLEMPEDGVPDIESNEDRLTQVLTIFLDNAIKYTDADGWVVIGARPAAGGAYFYVKDNGTGMDSETTGKIFDRFYQAEVSRSDKGNGLGLAIAKEILDKLKIKISVASAPGEGSEFGFVAPLY
jgi:signal transduction histidine kinase